MFIIAIDRSGCLHVLDNRFEYGSNHITFCGKMIMVLNLNTISIDSPIDFICKKCKPTLIRNFKFKRSSPRTKCISYRQASHIDDSRELYASYASKNWNRLYKYKNLINRTSKKYNE